MNSRILLAIVASSSLMTACSGGSAIRAISPFDSPRSATEIAREAGITAETQAKIRSGMSFQFRGTSAVLNISGNKRILSAASGQSVQTLLMPQGQPVLSFRHLDTIGGRSAQYVDEGCDECGPPPDGSPTPAPPPPNAASCNAAGGAAWEDAQGGVGCLGPGSTRGLSCGTWVWVSPGHGWLYPPQGPTVGGSWIDDSGGGLCTVG